MSIKVTVQDNFNGSSSEVTHEAANSYTLTEHGQLEIYSQAPDYIRIAVYANHYWRSAVVITDEVKMTK